MSAYSRMPWFLPVHFQISFWGEICHFLSFFLIRFKKPSQDFASPFWGLSIMIVIACVCEIFLIEVSWIYACSNHTKYSEIREQQISIGTIFTSIKHFHFTPIINMRIKKWSWGTLSVHWYSMPYPYQG